MPIPQFLKTQGGDYLFLPPQTPLAFSTAFLEYGGVYTEAVTVAMSREYATTVYEISCDRAPIGDAKPLRAQIMLDELINHFASQSTALTNDILDMDHFVRQMLPQFAQPRKEGA